jgi:hypothetical protein
LEFFFEMFWKSCLTSAMQICLNLAEWRGSNDSASVRCHSVC